jgi:hypothetical protein
MLLMDAFWCLIKHPLAPLGTAVLILEEVPKKRPLCRSGTMLLLLYVSIGAKRADFGTISRFVNFLMRAHHRDHLEGPPPGHGAWALVPTMSRLGFFQSPNKLYHEHFH